MRRKRNAAVAPSLADSVRCPVWAAAINDKAGATLRTGGLCDHDARPKKKHAQGEFRS